MRAPTWLSVGFWDVDSEARHMPSFWGAYSEAPRTPPIQPQRLAAVRPPPPPRCARFARVLINIEVVLGFVALHVLFFFHFLPLFLPCFFSSYFRLYWSFTVCALFWRLRKLGFLLSDSFAVVPWDFCSVDLELLWVFSRRANKGGVLVRSCYLFSSGDRTKALFGFVPFQDIVPAACVCFEVEIPRGESVAETIRYWGGPFSDVDKSEEDAARRAVAKLRDEYDFEIKDANLEDKKFYENLYARLSVDHTMVREKYKRIKLRKCFEMLQRPSVCGVRPTSSGWDLKKIRRRHRVIETEAVSMLLYLASNCSFWGFFVEKVTAVA
uniref:Uncharacterized protein n=1 Tax=Ananas comosus var. bracteatus TaxID=296719 RepID=A0A6V7NYL9_ANACO|nr:unnamed protein product [Ananas comosus var. bracteatus]